MFRICSLLIILLLPQLLQSQEDICIGKSYSFVSKELDEAYTLWVSLPASYDEHPDKHYPVLYVLDADRIFLLTQGLLNSYSKGKMAFPEFILVGLFSKNRNQDYTPTCSQYGRDGLINKQIEPIGGGASRYMRFLAHDVCPLIEQNYRSNQERMLIGHSLAGLLVLQIRLTAPDLFTSYLALDPSLWWDNGVLTDQISLLSELNPFQNPPSYIGIAGKDPNDRKTIHAQKNADFIARFSTLVDANSFFYRNFPEETHASVFVPGLIDGLNQLVRK